MCDCAPDDEWQFLSDFGVLKNSNTAEEKQMTNQRTTKNNGKKAQKGKLKKKQK